MARGWRYIFASRRRPGAPPRCERFEIPDAASQAALMAGQFSRAPVDPALVRLDAHQRRARRIRPPAPVALMAGQYSRSPDWSDPRFAPRRSA